MPFFSLFLTWNLYSNGFIPCSQARQLTCYSKVIKNPTPSVYLSFILSVLGFLCNETDSVSFYIVGFVIGNEIQPQTVDSLYKIISLSSCKQSVIFIACLWCMLLSPWGFPGIEGKFFHINEFPWQFPCPLHS